MSEFSAEEQSIINFFLDQYKNEADFTITTIWLEGILNKENFLCSIQPSLFDTQCLSIKMAKNHDRDSINQIKRKIMMVYATLKRLEKKGLIFIKPEIIFKAGPEFKHESHNALGNLANESRGIIKHFDTELSYICSIIIPSGTLLKLKENNYKSKEELQHEEQINLLKHQIKSDKEASENQISILEKQLSKSNWALFFAILIPLITVAISASISLFGTTTIEASSNDKTIPLPITINSEKFDTLNQEFISLEAKIDALKTEAAKIQAQLPQPKPASTRK